MYYLEALAKQHEAMKRALHLAERNKQLENELKDIDQMALAVEAEANCTVQSNAEKMIRYVEMYLASTGCKIFMQIAGKNARHAPSDPDLRKGSI